MKIESLQRVVKIESLQGAAEFLRAVCNELGYENPQIEVREQEPDLPPMLVFTPARGSAHFFTFELPRSGADGRWDMHEWFASGFRSPEPPEEGHYAFERKFPDLVVYAVRYWEATRTEERIRELSNSPQVYELALAGHPEFETEEYYEALERARR